MSDREIDKPVYTYSYLEREKYDLYENGCWVGTTFSKRMAALLVSKLNAFENQQKPAALKALTPKPSQDSGGMR